MPAAPARVGGGHPRQLRCRTRAGRLTEFEPVPETPWPMKAELPPIIKTGAVTAIRYERKWVPAGFSLAEVLAMVRRHPAAFRPAFPERQVNNIYLDTPE